ncbi:PD-(D/E)XK nuclease family protein [Chroococcidiopsis sp. CCMEE 29]|uniref:PD-(D/E)XK nuclease family protein n=1 Tax=Chroococcidiopsis sp. CCMEE 29 TaxID=155894 RepID=UPI002020F1EB|nr:PD-(D/E)XK nuclease family protein [Chroococcidiopsis sp. CCMEE 29]
MTRSLAIGENITTFRQVQEKLGLTLSEDSQFFTEWMAELPALSDTEQARLEQVRRNYLYQVSDGILLEETIKMVVLSPLLELAGFYQAPYKFRTEVPVEIEAEGDNGEILRGRIDALVLQDKLWIVLIESKKTTFDLELAIPQSLAYMAAHSEPEQPLYGMVTNGSSYLFVKTLSKQYGISDLFATRSQYRNNLYEVLRILKHLGQLILQS